MDPSRYFDHAATTPLDPALFHAMLPWLRDAFGNAHSMHAWGVQARQAVENARERVALAVGAEDPSQIIFTSGSTEACNWALSLRDEWAVSPYEHAAVAEPARAKNATLIPHRGPHLGVTDASAVAVMAVSNETGTWWDIRQTASPSAFKFVDATQALGKTQVELLGVDAAAFSAHKIYGPKGVGCLYVADPSVRAWTLGGGQEAGRRGGTLNVPGIVGFGEAARIAADRWQADAAHAAHLQSILIDELRDMGEARIVAGEESVSHILALMIPGVAAAPLVLELDARGFATSAGPACSADEIRPSPGLLAFGLSETEALSTLRISFGRANSPESTMGLAQALKESVRRLRGLG